VLIEAQVRCLLISQLKSQVVGVFNRLKACVMFDSRRAHHLDLDFPK
jgi:hypothetical protein